jgi:GntR family transcriptional repressor for pyruvate dehydrogenase complex
MPERHITITPMNKPMPLSSDVTLSSVQRELRLSDKVAEQLTDAILSGQIPAGSRLPSERELGDQLKVSRTVIREAVRSLAALGLVNVTAGRGVEVAADPKAANPSMRLMVRGYGEIDYGTVHEVRVPIEVQAAGLAARRATKKDIARLRKLCDRHAVHIANGDLPAAVEEDYAFHNEIATLAGNPLLKALYGSLSEVLNEVRTPARQSAEVAESGLRAHRWLLECMAAKDEVAARGAMERHLTEAERIWRGKKP